MIMDRSKKTLVIGATTNPSRYAYVAINRLRRYGHEVVAVGIDNGAVGDVPIVREKMPFNNVDTVTLYVRPAVQKESYEDYIVSLKPKRVIFNPGTENPAFEHRLRQEGIEPVEGCTLVMLAVGDY